MNKKLGFTMAEILLSLTIIGVVAAITLPSLMANINERTWNTQRKALYARMSQAIAMMPSISGYGEYEGTNTDGSVTATKDTAAEAFLTEGLSKVLKINNICDAAHLADCGVAASFTNLAGSTNTWPTKMSELNPMFLESFVEESTSNNPENTYVNPQKNIDTKAAAFETLNGETVALYYNPYCAATFDFSLGGAVYRYGYAQPLMCANFIYDLNGSKGPNTMGKDIGFITALYASDTVLVAPMPLNSLASSSAMSQQEASSACKVQDPESRLPNMDELSAMFYNFELLRLSGELGNFLWSGSNVNSWGTPLGVGQNMGVGTRHAITTDYTGYAHCIKR